MTRPYYTTESLLHIPHAGYCASDLVFQTGAIVVNDKEKVLLVEDPISHIIGLPRSYVPYRLDDLLQAPLAFLTEIGYEVDPLPLRIPTRRPKDPKDIHGRERPELAFAETATTNSFSIALDVAYLDESNLPRLADVRQSVVLWHGGILRGRLATKAPRPRARFYRIPEAIFLIESQPLPDCVAIEALRLFQKVLKASQPIPREPGAVALKARPNASHERHPKDAQCYPASMIQNAIFPVATPNTSAIVANAFWASADYIVRTGTVIFDAQKDVVLLAPGRWSDDPLSLPRRAADDICELLCNPLPDMEPKAQCSRLALPRMSKKYTNVDNCEDPAAETVLEFETTTNTFFVTFGTWWQHREKTIAKANGRQEITFWFAGSFDASQGIPQGFVALQFPQALTHLEDNDPYAFAALTLFRELWDAAKNDVVEP